MEITAHDLSGVFLITPQPKADTRGYFMRSYDVRWFEQKGLHRHWVQENQSLTRAKGTIRGLHFQWSPATETKLIRCITGAIYDVFVDLRRQSPSFGKWGSATLSQENGQMIWLPRGFAHGFCSLQPDCLVQYKVDAPYSPELDCGIRWNDPDLAIDWPVEQPLISEKDGRLMSFSSFVGITEKLVDTE